METPGELRRRHPRRTPHLKWLLGKTASALYYLEAAFLQVSKVTTNWTVQLILPVSRPLVTSRPPGSSPRTEAPRRRPGVTSEGSAGDEETV